MYKAKVLLCSFYLGKISGVLPQKQDIYVAL